MKKVLSMIFVAYALLVFVTHNSVVDGGGAPEKIIHLTAKKFEFTPGEITAKKGEPVVLEIKSEDVNHGFSLPDFGVRGDVKPGEVTRIRFTPDKTGQFTFTCDVFCGTGHEEMSGTLTVTE
jgi:cytochrome c oxidase subunit II